MCDPQFPNHSADHPRNAINPVNQTKPTPRAHCPLTLICLQQTQPSFFSNIHQHLPRPVSTDNANESLRWPHIYRICPGNLQHQPINAKESARPTVRNDMRNRAPEVCGRERRRGGDGDGALIFGCGALESGGDVILRGRRLRTARRKWLCGRKGRGVGDGSRGS